MQSLILKNSSAYGPLHPGRRLPGCGPHRRGVRGQSWLCLDLPLPVRLQRRWCRGWGIRAIPLPAFGSRDIGLKSKSILCRAKICPSGVSNGTSFGSPGVWVICFNGVRRSGLKAVAVRRCQIGGGLPNLPGPDH